MTKSLKYRVAAQVQHNVDNEVAELMAELNSGPTRVFCLRAHGYEVWKAMWRGRVSLGEWTQRGPAQVWVDLCETSGRFRA